MDSKNLLAIGGAFTVGILCGALFFKKFPLRNAQKKPNQNVSLPSQDINNQSKQVSSYLQDRQYIEIKNEQVARIIKFFGEEKYKKLENSFVVVFGVGGVGSHVVNMIARSGVKRIRIVDFDTISISSLNRHSFGLREDVGTLKVDCMKKYIHKIFPHIQIEAINVYVTVDNVRLLLEADKKQILSALDNKQYNKFEHSSGKPDYIIDCIDNLDAKVELISVCVQKGLKLIVSGGAGMKNDPTKLQIRDISECKYDKLIMRIKRELSKKNIKSGVKVVFSYQQAQKQLLPLTQNQQQNPNAYKVFDNYRIRIVPVLGTMPAMIGMAIASYVLCDLADQPYEPFETDYVKSSTIGKIYNQLQYQIKKMGKSQDFLRIDIEEVSILAKKIYNWRCLIKPEKKADRLALWDKSKPASIQNLALMCKQSCEKHMKASCLQDMEYSKEILERFQEYSKSAKKVMDSGFMMFI